MPACRSPRLALEAGWSPYGDTSPCRSRASLGGCAPNSMSGAAGPTAPETPAPAIKRSPMFSSAGGTRASGAAAAAAFPGAGGSSACASSNGGSWLSRLRLAVGLLVLQSPSARRSVHPVSTSGRSGSVTSAPHSPRQQQQQQQQQRQPGSALGVNVTAAGTSPGTPGSQDRAGKPGHGRHGDKEDGQAAEGRVDVGREQGWDISPLGIQELRFGDGQAAEGRVVDVSDIHLACSREALGTPAGSKGATDSGAAAGRAAVPEPTLSKERQQQVLTSRAEVYERYGQWFEELRGAHALTLWFAVAVVLNAALPAVLLGAQKGQNIQPGSMAAKAMNLSLLGVKAAYALLLTCLWPYRSWVVLAVEVSRSPGATALHPHPPDDRQRHVM